MIYPNSIRNIPKSTKFRLVCNVDNKIVEIFQSDLDPGFYNEEKLLKKIKSHIDNWDVNKSRDTLETSLKKIIQ